MKLSRRAFLEISCLTPLLGFSSARAQGTKSTAPSKIRYAKETTTICPYCGVGCGLIISAKDMKVVNVEGDPDHPINQGSLCCKGQGLYQVATSDRRMTKVLYRAPKSTKWEEKPWDWAINRIADRIKKTRDESFTEKDKKGRVVNRTHAIAGLGGAALDDQECYLYGKLMRALGMVYIEHQARI